MSDKETALYRDYSSLFAAYKRLSEVSDRVFGWNRLNHRVLDKTLYDMDAYTEAYKYIRDLMQVDLEDEVPFEESIRNTVERIRGHVASNEKSSTHLRERNKKENAVYLIFIDCVMCLLELDGGNNG